MNFDGGYATVPDYIIGITRRIWEERGVNLIRRWYAEDCVMHTPLGDVHGVEAVVSGTLETLQTFPDRRLLPEDVIYSEGEGEAAYSSHRIVSTQHHWGEGAFGPATGRSIWARTVADCRIERGVIVEEWLVRDQAAIALQVGLDPRELGARNADALAWAGKGVPTPGPVEDAAADHDGRGGGCAALMRRVLQDADLAAIRTECDEAVNLHLPTGRSAFGHDGFDAWAIGLSSAFPGARVGVEHVIARADPGRAERVALRWRLVGTHAGRGAFGPPSGARISVLGITHFELVAGRIVRAFILVDELAIWTAIALHRG
ncbi:MAG: ester cyclase [Acetobacteraceae bacterium]|nr:ester cyclase [Acetobacteraceae bacterium]